MRRLKRPPFTARDTLDLCIDSIRNEQFCERLSVIREAVTLAEAEYIQHGDRQELFLIPQSLGIGDIRVDEMKRVYKDTFAKSAKTRRIYDQIKKLPVNDICPICGQRTVGSLDHYLAQSLHSALVVTPVNLVPACTDCNKTKLDAQPETGEKQTLHPYFDDIDDGTWLHAAVVESAPASLRFFASPPLDWPPQKRERTINHFDLFGLGLLYASHSGVELTNIRYGLQKIAERGTVEDIRAELADRAESAEAAQKNSWQTAMYRALSKSDWFCGGGFS